MLGGTSVVTLCAITTSALMRSSGIASISAFDDPNAGTLLRGNKSTSPFDLLAETYSVATTGPDC